MQRVLDGLFAKQSVNVVRFPVVAGATQKPKVCHRGGSTASDRNDVIELELIIADIGETFLTNVVVSPDDLEHY